MFTTANIPVYYNRQKFNLHVSKSVTTENATLDAAKFSEVNRFFCNFPKTCAMVNRSLTVKIFFKVLTFDRAFLATETAFYT